jgi:hypothetical protein
VIVFPGKVPQSPSYEPISIAQTARRLGQRPAAPPTRTSMGADAYGARGSAVGSSGLAYARQVRQMVTFPGRLVGYQTCLYQTRAQEP